MWKSSRTTAKSIVPLARVLMAYGQSKRKLRGGGEFSSISRQLERGSVKFNPSATDAQKKAYGVTSHQHQSETKLLDKRKTPRRKSKTRRSLSLSARDAEKTECLIVPPEMEVQTLVGDLSHDEDPDVLKQDFVTDRMRVLSAPHSGRPDQPLTGLRRSQCGPPKSNVVTLEMPTKFRRTVKNVSLLSQLPVKTWWWKGRSLLFWLSDNLTRSIVYTHRKWKHVVVFRYHFRSTCQIFRYV